MLISPPLAGRAQTERSEERSVKIYFRRGTSALDENYMDNKVALQKFAEQISKLYGEAATAEPRQVYIYSSVSPEGDASHNSRLAQGRVKSISDWINRELKIDIADAFISHKTDWDVLSELVHQREDVPYRDEVIEILENDYSHKVRLNALATLRGGEPYKWLYTNLFPYMRYAAVECEFWVEPAPIQPEQPENKQEVVVEEKVEKAEEVEQQVAVNVKEKTPFYMSLKTNMLYDLATIPNLGVEFYLGGNMSVAANGHLAWWKKDSKALYWRAVGGDVALRYWFGKASRVKPLTGHHVGVYGQTITYDFDLGSNGIMAEKLNWAAGVEYGYSLPVARRLNIDFTAGVGYHWGIYKEYTPIDGHYSWLSTNRRKYFGPTKLEVSLVWLLGSGNYNKEKGGRR